MWVDEQIQEPIERSQEQSHRNREQSYRDPSLKDQGLQEEEAQAAGVARLEQQVSDIDNRAPD